MTFEEWWDENSVNYLVSRQYHFSSKEVAEAAWNAARLIPEEAFRAKVIMECRAACLGVMEDADEASKAKDVVDNYRCGYIDASVDCDEALFQLLRVPQERS